MYSVLFFLTLFVISCSAVNEEKRAKFVNDAVSEYFSSETVNKFRDLWTPHQIAIQTAIEQALKRDYSAVNTMQRAPVPGMTLSRGFFVNDNVVQVAFGCLKLREVPMLRMTDVTVDLPSNVITVETLLGTLFIDTNYKMFRDHTDIVYSNNRLDDPYLRSPFSYQQVHPTGNLTIVAENCQISGHVITKLGTDSVNLGFNTLWVKGCMYSVEISSTGTGSPPVIAPYFAEREAILLNSILTIPLRNELMTRLQSAVYSYINTPTIFGADLEEIKLKQHGIFAHTLEYNLHIVRTLNVKGSQLLANKLGVAQLGDRSITVVPQSGEDESVNIEIESVSVNGFDNAHSAHIGGPYQIAGNNRISELIRYDSLQVTGSFKLNEQNKEEHIVFGGELKDVNTIADYAADTTSEKVTSTTSSVLRLLNWGTTEISMKSVGKRKKLRFLIQSMIVGYLLDKLSGNAVLLSDALGQRINLDNDGPVINKAYAQDVLKLYPPNLSSSLGDSVADNEGTLDQDSSLEENNEVSSGQDKSLEEDNEVTSGQDKSLEEDNEVISGQDTSLDEDVSKEQTVSAGSDNEEDNEDNLTENQVTDTENQEADKLYGKNYYESSELTDSDKNNPNVS